MNTQRNTDLEHKNPYNIYLSKKIVLINLKNKIVSFCQIFLLSC